MNIRTQRPLFLAPACIFACLSSLTLPTRVCATTIVLEAALKEFGKDLKDERWEKVAEKVAGRTPKECKARFKELAKAIKAKKAATQK